MLKQVISSLRGCIEEVFAEKLVTHYTTGVSKVVFLKDGAAHRVGDNPARIFFERKTGIILREEYCQNGTLRRKDDKPTIIIYNNDGSVDSYLTRAEYVQNRPCWKASFSVSQP
jgi:hypothetical protein